MLTFLSEFGMLFALFAGVILVIAWRQGWFSEHLADDISVQPKEADGFLSSRRSKSRRNTAPPPEETSAGAESDVSVTTLVVDRGEVEPDDASFADVVARATETAQKRAAKDHPAHWSKEALQQRAGWLLFEPSDFLGEPDMIFEMPIPETDSTVRIPLFAAARVRHVERDNTLIAMSRRKVVQSRWDRRAAHH